MTVQLKRNDTKDTITYTVTNLDGSVVNLTGATVKFVMGKGKTLITNAAATIVNAVTGEVSYTLIDADTLVAGTFNAEFEVTFSDGKIKTYPNNGYIRVNIQANIDTDLSTYIEDNIAYRVSDIQILKNEVQAQLDQFAVGATNEETAQARVESDGTTNTTLKARLDKKEAEFKTFKTDTTTQLAQRTTKEYVDAEIEKKANGSPKGVYATLTDLQTALPTGSTDNMLVTSDGKWYYWNGTAWTAGAVYQATGIADTSIGVEKLNVPYAKSFKNSAYQNGGYLTPSYSGTAATYIGSMGNYNNLPAGNYLVFADFGLTGADLINATFNPMLFDGTNTRIPATAVQSPAYAAAVDKTKFIAYGIVNVPAVANFRTGIYVSNMNTGRTNILTLNVNKLYVIPMDTVNDDVVNAIKYFTGVLNYVPTLSMPDVATNKTDIASLKQNVAPTSPILAFGDSMTGSTSGWVNTLATTNGVSILNRGIGGQTAGQIATRQGGLPLIINPFTIPSDTSEVAVTLNQTLYAQQSANEGINPVYINGIQGTIRNSTNTSGGFTFSRTTAGSAITITRPTIVYTDNMQTYRKHPMVIWVGTNGDYSTSSRTSDNLIEIIERMLSYGECQRYLVIGLTTDADLGIPAINTAIEKKFGRRFLDLRSYLISYGLSDMGITPTTDDNNRIVANNVPSSLLSDTTHLTNDCQVQVVAPLVYKKLQELYMV